MSRNEPSEKRLFCHACYAPAVKMKKQNTVFDGERNRGRERKREREI